MSSIKYRHTEKKLGSRLKSFRKMQGLNVTRFAKLIEISQGSLSELENNKSKPSSDTLASMVRHTDINIAWLLTGEGDPILRKDASLPNHMDEDPVVSELLKAARTVLKSGNPVAIDALERNIRYFAHAIESERRYNAMEKRISTVEQELKKASERIREGDPPEEKEEIIKNRAI